MKSLFSTIMNNLLFSFAKRLAIVCLFLSYAISAAAGGDDWTGTAYAKAKFAKSDNVSIGMGKVYVGTSETPIYGEWSEEVSDDANQDNEDNPKNFTFYWSANTANNDKNSAFAGWYKDETASEIHTSDPNFQDVVSVQKNVDDNTATKTYYALFRKVIDAPVEVSWTKNTDVATTTFDVNLYKATNFTVKSFAHKEGLPRAFEAAATLISTEKATITLSAGKDVVAGDVFNVVLATDNGGDVTVQVKIVSKITVRFELPKRGQGYYEAIQPNNGNAKTYNSQDVGESKNVDLTDTRQFYQSINAYPADGYRLYRWVVTDKDGNISYPTSNLLEKTLNDGDVISVEFLPTNIAQFMVKDDPEKKLFYELDGDNGAFKRAETLGKKVVVVHTSGTLYTEYKSITNEKYEFTIPADYTLLIPGDAAYTVTKALEKSHLVEDAPGSEVVPYRTLTLLPNTNIIAYGNICVYANVSYYHGANGTPINPGIIHMRDGSIITLKDKSVLTAFGYITGDHLKSEVIAESGSKVYELFQLRDWRGGTVTLQMKYGGQVFPFNQYYIQSIETKLTINSGATLYGSSGVKMTLVNETPMNVILISQTSNDANNGLFVLGSDTHVSKWYDSENDKQMYEIKGLEENASATIGNIHVKISSTTLDSEDYILPFTNNLDVTLDNIDFVSDKSVAFLPGSKLTLKNNSTVTTTGQVYVHDAECLFTEGNTGFCYIQNGGDRGAVDYEYMPIWYTANKSFDDCKKRSRPTDAEIDIQNGCQWIVDRDDNDNTYGLYTTGAEGSEPVYGANITSSTGGGKVVFKVKGTEQNTHGYTQINPKEEYIEIPITNARLRNEDAANPWVAGELLSELPEEYTYSKEKGKWVTPQEMSFGTWENNEWSVRIPESGTVTQIVEISLITEETLTMDNFDIVWPNNAYFVKGGDATYDAANWKLLVPITYKLTKVHNKDVEPNAYVGDLVVKCKDLNVTGGVVATANIRLSAVEDYTPEFTIKINEVPVTTGSMYDFGQTDAQIPVPANLSIIPTEGTVATLANTQWNVVTTGSFKATQTSVTYNPQTQTTGEYDEGTLTIIATYPDAATPPNQPACTVTVNLQGKAKLQESTLAFKDDLAIEIYQAEELTDVFKNLGSLEDIEFTYEYADGNDAPGLFEYRKESDGNYTLIAKTTDYVDNRVVTVIATQGASAVMAGAERRVTITIKPVVTWNWSTLYFNTERENPVTVARAGDWTLTEVEGSDPNNLVALSGESPNYSATVGAGDASQVYTAKFKFVQGSYENEFTSSIYSDPRVLGFCVHYVRQFNDVSTPTETTVTFDENSHKATFRPGDKWEINMTGMPDKLTFTATGNNTWYIGERASSSTNYSDVVAWSKLSGTQTIQLKPTTNQVIIQYGAGDDNGTITNLCISELEISADKDAIYFPINKDGSETTKKLILTHTEPTSPEVSLDSHFTTTLSAVSNNLGTTPEEPYYQTTVTISGNMSAVEKGSYVLTATQGTATITTLVHADFVPQGLPIQLATDDAKRYHFVAVEEDKVTWDETTKHVVFQTPEGEQTIRSVTFAFEGAPSRIKFTASQDIIDNQWRVDESADGSEFVTSGLANRDTEAGTEFVHNLQYTTRYVRLVYNSENKSEVELSNFVIEGDPMLFVNPEELEFSADDTEKSLTLTAINLNNIRIELDNVIDFQMSHGDAAANATYTLSSTDYPDALGNNKVGDIVLKTEWITNSIVNDGMITIYNVDDENAILAKVKLVGAGKYLHKEEAKTTGLYTGIPDGTRDTDGDGNPNTDYKYTFHGSNYTDYSYHQVDLSNAFAADGTALFDLLFVYGETTTTDAAMNITAPAGDKGSNARTPYYVYVRDVDAYGNYDRYRFVTMVDNANVGDKTVISGIISSTTEESVEGETNHGSAEVKYINVTDTDKPLSVYITGFAPYATTGYTKGDEGVFFFRGVNGSKLDIYLEDAHIFARNKMKDGQPFYTRGDERNPTFTEGYARGSGGVLVFENLDVFEEIDKTASFEVSIHTIGNNLLKSNYGCFNYFFGMDPFQISAPIHVRLNSEKHLLSKTTLNFDDIWPTQLDAERKIANSKRTNGFLGLKKLNNNAPSIDLGNPYTTVNFNGGQVQLQNAQIVSTNYKTTLAISYRAGEYGGDKVGLRFAYGIGTDDVGGTVNFYDGTITVEPMWVKEEYKNYYFIDKDEHGNEIKKQVGTITNGDQTLPVYEYQTTCLRCPKNTNVYGGSICWLRACQHVTSKGGAPAGGDGVDVGQYIYEFNSDKGDKIDENTQLVTSIQFPANIQNADGSTLESYFNVFYPKNAQDKGEYGLKSITPDDKGKLYFWIPEGYGGVTAEKDKFLTTWKACMTEISAGMNGITGTVGGNTAVEKNEEIKYMLYCQIDQNISDVITAGEGEGDKKKYSYSAPVKVPDVAQAFYGSSYTSLSPTSVGDELQNEVVSAKPYEVTDKVYYITTATADVWQTFTAPFDVAKIWVVETYSEAELEKLAKAAKEAEKNARDEVMLAQAKHNADFAAFFGVAMAIGTSDPLETIFNDFKEWGMIQDSKTTDDKENSITPLYPGTGAYTLRDRYQLIPYNGSNWNNANFYLNHNVADWEIIGTNEYDDPICEVHWELPAVDNDGVPEDGILMHKGETYSMLLPYCTGCWNYDSQNKLIKRDFWDYWSGKFLIFESVDHSTDNKNHTIEGSEYFKEDWTDEELALSPSGIFIPDNLPADNYAKVTGNSTFAFMEPINPNLYVYYPSINSEGFFLEEDPIINPTTAFMLANLPENINGMPARGVKRSGEIIYDQPDDDNNGNQNGTSGHMPTVGGGNDLFITSIAGGINVAVAAPQNVRVLSSTGAVIYSGYVTTAVDIQLPTTGIYIVSGENEVQKILF